MNKRNEHIVKSYDEELARLRGEILGMGELALEQMSGGMRALREGDGALAEEVIAADARIDKLELEVSGDVLRLLALRQPMAGDLRGVLSSLRIAADIERIGDYAANVAKRSLALSEAQPRAAVNGLSEMVEFASGMLREVLDAYAAGDAVRALDVRDRDVDLDARYNSLFRELLTYMMESPSVIGTCTHFLFIAKNIERIGDHVTNIAENIWFQAEGELPADERPKGDNTNIPLTP
ncbi:phosphate signaling complex protein PhoU [Alkalisalibacterium limincola]|uniref:Phosphate-specific transport system accessory protein PhoU n=1 Tax=Alkalisalibacterium limincola TaxID=2699169 RepID=A0A5C8KYP3_9GAMM|nr:phosphate signaling complex protein PhoU [Alkalisalibacterium limincola]TXK65937.1 phosphate signaling complex protein PhoU [Alkalisalibacterium limincola]